jgi:predicted Co/Zn/Cd cation transporter (cation efflux family)
MVVAFSVARALVGGSWARGASYIDPSLVLVAAAMFVAAPIRMMRRTLFELIEGSVTSSVGSIINDVVGNVEGEYGLKDPVIRMSKVGRKVYVEVGYVVGSGWTVADGDSMRRRLRESLGETGLTTWLTLEFSLAHENLL